MRKTIMMLLMVAPLTSLSSEITFGFKNPSFSGVGTGSHYLTIENQESSRKKAIEDALEAAQKPQNENQRTLHSLSLFVT